MGCCVQLHWWVLVSAILSFSLNIADRVVDSTQLFMLLAFVMLDWESSAGSMLRSYCKMATGLQETVSEALCCFPGKFWMVNLYLRIFFFSLNNRGFWSLLRSLSPNYPFSCSWSVTTMRLGQSMINMQHFSNVHAIAAVSPSISMYLHSVSIWNLMPVNIRHQCSGQQTGALSVVHEQCFCWSRKPILSLLQSRVR